MRSCCLIGSAEVVSSTRPGPHELTLTASRMTDNVLDVLCFTNLTFYVLKQEETGLLF